MVHATQEEEEEELAFDYAFISSCFFFNMLQDLEDCCNQTDFHQAAKWLGAVKPGIGVCKTVLTMEQAVEMPLSFSLQP